MGRFRCFECKVKDMEKLGVYEPLVVNKQLIKSATEAANMILKIDDMIASGKTKMPSGPGECMWDAAWRIWWNATRILAVRTKDPNDRGDQNYEK